ncbi:hypothetical protein Tcan_17916 [Toxocara canis]|uniref:Uncharacterized protein n=1 Tax=Toxocara canis TaxID=6265 RepID=A0A0B2W292_TOXCA|nr:hypothetical protein Tcan_17916 [Toxocara canis]
MEHGAHQRDAAARNDPLSLIAQAASHTPQIRLKAYATAGSGAEITKKTMARSKPLAEFVVPDRLTYF